MNRTIAVTVILVAATLFAQTTSAPALQKGISVKMAVTQHASPMPEADSPDAWIVTITRDGSLYFGADKMTPNGLLDKMKATPRDRSAKLYLKADTSALFGDVERVLDDARLGSNTAVFLTSQPAPSLPGKLVPPKGLTVWVGPESTSGPVTIELLSSGQTLPTLKVAGESIERRALKTTLAHQREESLGNLEVVLKVDAKVDFEHVVHVIDVCHSFGARVVLPKPE